MVKTIAENEGGLEQFAAQMRSIGQSTAHIIATALIHSKFDYCNSFLLNLPSSQTQHVVFNLF